MLASQQAQRAEAERWQQLYHRSQARLMAAQSELLRAQDAVRLELSVLLAAESLRREPTLEAAQSLQQGLKLLPPRGRLAVAHDDGRVNDLVFTADGRWLVSAGDDGTLRIHDVAAGREQARLDIGGRVMALQLAPGGACVAAQCFQSGDLVLARVPDGACLARLPHPADVTAAAWLPDGTRLLTGAADGRVRLWRVPDVGAGPGAQEPPLVMDVGGVPGALALSPQGDAFLCACNASSAQVRGTDGALALFDLAAGTESWRQALGAAALDVAFASGGKLAVSAGWDLQARVFDASTGRPVVAVTHSQVVTKVVTSPDGQRLASLSDDGIAAVLDLALGEVVARLRPQGGVMGAAFSPDGRWLATCGLGALVQVWDIATQQELLRGTGASGANAIAFAPDGAALAVARWARIDSVRLLDDGEGLPLRHGRAMQAGAFSGDGRLAALAPGGGRLEVADLARGQRVAVFGVPEDIEFVHCSGDGRRVLTQEAGTGVVCAWDVASGRELWRSASAPALHGAQLSPCGRYAALTPLQGDLAWIRAVEDGTLLATLPFRAPLTPAFSPDGAQVLTAGDDAGLRVCRSADGAEVQVLPHDGPLYGARFSPSGAQVVGHADDGRILVWDRGSSAVLLQLEQGGGYVSSVACSADGRWLASAGETSVRVWDAASGAPGPQFVIEGGVDYVTFTPDSECVAAGSRDHRARIWNLASGTEVACIAFEGEVFEMDFDVGGGHVLIEHVRGARRYRTAWRWRPADLLALAEASVTRTLTDDERRRYVADEAPR